MKRHPVHSKNCLWGDRLGCPFVVLSSMFKHRMCDFSIFLFLFFIVNNLWRDFSSIIVMKGIWGGASIIRTVCQSFRVSTGLDILSKIQIHALSSNPRCKHVCEAVRCARHFFARWNIISSVSYRILFLILFVSHEGFQNGCKLDWCTSSLYSIFRNFLPFVFTYCISCCCLLCQLLSCFMLNIDHFMLTCCCIFHCFCSPTSKNLVCCS